jgi:uncharacterized protein
MTAVLGLFAKWPLPGTVKTRLAAATSATWAASIAQAFLRDALRRLATVQARRVLVYSPADTVKHFEAFPCKDFVLRPQIEGDLGRRLAAFFSDAFAEGATRVVVVGTDSPTLPVAFVESAFEQLQHVDVVLGPATDGGYTLIGCAHRPPPLFDGIAWSGSHVLAQTVDRLRQASLRLAVLPPWYDVDSLDDWHMLCGHLKALRLAGVDPDVPFTEALLNDPP